MAKYFIFITIFTLSLSFGVEALAVEDELVVETQKRKYVLYEEPTVKKLSQLYWALGKLDINNDANVDNFLRINECDIFQDYSQNEFEWKTVRESGRNFIEKNKENFPIYFQFEQPLRFAEYDLDTHEFKVLDKYKIDSARRFEVIATDVYEDTCGLEYSQIIPGYPRSLLAELNRPVNLTYVKVDPELAEKYVADKLEYLKKTVEKDDYSPEEVYGTRDAYIVLKIRAFSAKEDVKVKGTYARTMAKVLAVLESYEIYGDKDHKMLLHSEDFKRQKTRSAMEIELKKKYKERLKKQLEAKKAAAETAAAAE